MNYDKEFLENLSTDVFVIVNVEAPKGYGLFTDVVIEYDNLPQSDKKVIDDFLELLKRN